MSDEVQDDDVVEEALKSGIDLRDYSARVEQELREVQEEAVQDYIEQAEQIASLHGQISSCDTVLMKMEEMLAGFQASLGCISTEIQCLQEQSIDMNVRLENRQSVRGELSQFVDDMVVSKAMIDIILESPVSEQAFMQQAHELHHKITFVKTQQFKEAAACKDVVPVIEQLKIKVIEKSRQFFIGKVYQLRKPLTNYHVAQNAMLKHRFLFEFVVANERSIAKEIREEYVDTMSKIFYSYFKTYVGRLIKLQHDDVASKEDVLGAEDVARGTASAGLALFSSKPTLRNRATVFSAGERLNVLTTELEAPVIVPHAAKDKYHWEMLYRSVQFALVEHACREYMFVCDFFLVSGQTATQLFDQLLGKAMQIVQKAVHDYCTTSYDAIALQISIQLTIKYSKLMTKRQVNALDEYWQSAADNLRARFNMVMSLHTDSVRNADPTKTDTVDTRPHYIVRRYAEFASALLIACQSDPDDMLSLAMHRLHAEVEMFIGRVSACVPGGRKEALVCAINNYDVVVGVLGERLGEDTQYLTAWKELVANSTSEYSAEILWPYFGAVINFVNECEPLMQRNENELLAKYVQKVDNIVKSFGAQWKQAIQQINAEIMKSFTNFNNGTNILQTCLTELIQYYHRFHTLLSHNAFSSCAARNQLVNIHHLMVEVKKYKSTF